MGINWGQIEVVIFDVDGTLYDPKKLKKFMLIELLKYYIPRPWKLLELKILQEFRAQREIKTQIKFDNLYEAQYNWVAKKTGADSDQIKQIVEKWIYNAPLKYLPQCRYPYLVEFMNKLATYNKKKAVFSDYPSVNKLQALEIEVDKIVCSTDPELNTLKPSPEGLLIIADYFKVPIGRCVFIGDREDRDGLSAKKIGMEYKIVRNRNFYLNMMDKIK